MASVATTERPIKKLARKTSRVKSHGRKGSPSPGSAPARVPSEAAKRAIEAFAELQVFFSSPSQLREAFDWSAPTLRSWLQEPGPARPRTRSVERVFQLREVAQEAAKWVSEPWRVGDWLLEPNPVLGNISPVQVVATLGQEGVDGLCAGMASIAPREKALPEPVEISPYGLRKTLLSLNAPTMPDAPPVNDIEIPDFD